MRHCSYAEGLTYISTVNKFVSLNAFLMLSISDSLNIMQYWKSRAMYMYMYTSA